MPGQQKAKSSKRQRSHKVSDGKRRSSQPVKLTGVEKVLMGKGQFTSFKPIGQRH